MRKLAMSIAGVKPGCRVMRSLFQTYANKVDVGREGKLPTLKLTFGCRNLGRFVLQIGIGRTVINGAMQRVQALL